MFRFVLISVALAVVTGQGPSPFCDICTCNINKTEVFCNHAIGIQLWTNTSWFDTQTKQIYPLERVTVQNSPVLSLEQPFPQSDVVYLNLANNSIVNISDNIFSNLQKMEVLILSYNNIQLLHPNAFYGKFVEGDVYPLSSLKEMYLDHNKIHSLDGDTFEHTSRVEVLSVAHNPLVILDQQTIVALTSLPSLKHLDLSYTQLSTLPDYFLHTPKNLDFLDLSGNAFERVPEALKLSTSLRTLFLNNNPIVNITRETGFPNISTLEILHISHMPKLANVSKGALSNLSNLRELYVYGNSELTHLDQDALSAKRDGADYNTWPPLSKLYIQDNKLARLDMQFIMPWKNLKELDMTDNPWTCECENEWMVDELMPIYEKIDIEKAKALKCAAPIEMASTTFYEIYKKEGSMRCLDAYGNRPERDGIMLVGVLAGVLITIPIILFVVYAYQRHWFGLFDNSPAAFSRQFYKRTVSNDEYF